MKKVTILTGHYGSGKTNVCTNLAVALAHAGERVTVVDFDLVNPYFRTADFRGLFETLGIRLVTPAYANTNLDIPALCFDLERLAEGDGYLLVDVGGDDAGAVALGRSSAFFRAMAEEVDLFCVLNARRYPENGVEEAVQVLREMEAASRLSHTGLINNTNLGPETTPQVILEGIPFAEAVAKQTGLPVVMTTAPDFAASPLLDQRVCYQKRYVRLPWEAEEEERRKNFHG